MSQLILSLMPDIPPDDPAFLKEQIITYIGNKRRLLPFLGEGIKLVRQRLNKERLRTVDLFSGSGIVARYLKSCSKLIIANDLEAYSQVVNECFLSNRSALAGIDLPGILEDLRRDIDTRLSQTDEHVRSAADGFITELYSPRDENNITQDDRVFYTRRNARFLDAARQSLESLSPSLRKYFLGPLLSEASVHANTSGVFKGFYKSKEGVGQYGGHGRNALTRILGDITLNPPVLSRFETDYKVYRADANTLVSKLPKTDLTYLDPPYNQHPYGSNYFMLNILTNYERPASVSRVSGIPVHWNKSDYNKKLTAADALFQLVEKCTSPFILISYNSEGFISETDFMQGLERLGKVTRLETDYNTFRGSRNLKNRALLVKEFLFLLEKK